MTVWTVPATVLRVVDADTLEVLLDLGWHVTYSAKVRLAGLNAPEMSTPEGVEARRWVLGQLTNPDPFATDPPMRPVVVMSHSLDKYGRVLGSVFWTDQPQAKNAQPLPPEAMHCLNTEMLAAGHAVPM